MKPSFLVIGAMKAGTTSLHHYLASHPRVFMSSPKELRFFSGENWHRGLGWYEDHFAGSEGATAVGETSPAYSQADIFPEAAPRIAEVLPGVRLVYLVREPVARMASMYLHLAAIGRESRPAAEALDGDPVYLNSSRYRWQIDHHLPLVGRDRVLVITSEDLRDRRRQTLGATLSFLGIDGDEALDLGREHHPSAPKRRRRALSHRLGAHPWYRSASRHLPEPVRRLTRRVTTRALEVPTLPPELVADLHRRLAPDVAALRELMPKGWDGWGIA